MAEGIDVFKARLTATDEVTPVIKAIQQQAKALGHDLEEVGRKQHDLHRPEIWERMHEGASHAGEAVHKLSEHFELVKGGMEKVVELIPQLSALSALVGVVGVAENVYKTAEGFAVLAHSAEALGMSADQLQRWNGIAKLTDTDAESMGKSMGRLNRVLGEVTHGKNKDAAALFKHLHLNPRDFRDAADALPALSSAFQRTHDTGMRARMAFALFGRAGTDMIPMLNLGPDKLREIGSEVDKSSFKFADSAESLLAMKDHMAELELTVQGFTNELGAGLVPVLDPVIKHMRDWLQVNKDWLAGKIIDDVKWLRDEIQNTDWGSFEHKLEVWGKTAEELADDIGGITTAVEVLGSAIAARSVLSFASDIAAATGMFSSLTAGWGRVAASAEGAALAQRGAAAGGGVLGLAGAAAVGAVTWAYEANKEPATVAWHSGVTIPNDMKDNKRAIRERYIEASPAWRAQFDAMEVKHGNHTIRDVDRISARDHDTINGATVDRPALHSIARPSFHAPPAAVPRPMTPPPNYGHGGGSRPIDCNVKTVLEVYGFPAGVSMWAHSTGAASPTHITSNPNQAFHDLH